jgi:hypothetical protein
MMSRPTRREVSGAAAPLALGAPLWLRRAAMVLAAAALAGLPGCRILADELVMLDRAAPAAIATPDAPRSDLGDRP